MIFSGVLPMKIVFREITLVKVWSTEWKGRFRKQGDRLRGHCKIMVLGIEGRFRRNGRN